LSSIEVEEAGENSRSSTSSSSAPDSPNQNGYETAIQSETLTEKVVVPEQIAGELVVIDSEQILEQTEVSFLKKRTCIKNSRYIGSKIESSSYLHTYIGVKTTNIKDFHT